MKVIFFVILYFLAILFESFIFPAFFGINSPSLGTAVFLMGVSLQEFVPGFWFAGLSGAIRDAISLQSSAWNTIFSLGLFFAVRLFLTASQLEEPLRGISAVAVGLLAILPVWFLDSAAGIFFFGAEGPHLAWQDLASPLARREIIFAIGWFSVFSWLAIKLWEKKRNRRLWHL